MKRISVAALILALSISFCNYFASAETVIVLLRLADETSTTPDAYPRPVDRKMFFTGPHDPPTALKSMAGLVAL